jgi:hypothetical protein
MHCCADEAVAPASDTAAALSANPPAKASAIANLVTVVLMFLLQFFVVPRAQNGFASASCNAQFFEVPVSRLP